MIIIIFYIVIVLLLILLYFYLPNKSTITDTIAIISGITVALGLLNIVNSDYEKIEKDMEERADNYINNVSEVFHNIDTMYINNSKDLNNLYYEFYGFNNFPVRKNTTNLDKNLITDLEYITIQKITDYLFNIFITNPEIYYDINFKNKIIDYTKSNKFKNVFSYIKNNYSPSFIKLLNDQQIIKNSDIYVESINIPKLN